MNDSIERDSEQEQREDEKSRRRRLLAILGRIRNRVDQVCGVVDDANALIRRASDIVSDIRSVLEAPELLALLPANAQAGLADSAARLERVEDFLEKVGAKARVPADICSRVNEALDIAEDALRSPSQWDRILDRVSEYFGGMSLRQRLASFVIGAAAVFLGWAGLANAFGGDDGSRLEAQVFGVYMLSPAFTLQVGESVSLDVRVEAEGGVDISEDVSITWSVDDESVGLISDDGVLEGVNPGIVGVTVEAAGLSDYREFTVEGAALPDLVVEFNDPVFVDCSGRGCVHTIVVEVLNVGEADSGRAVVTVQLDGSLTAEEIAGALAAGDSTEVLLTFPPGGSCYNPDCSVVAWVDRADQVEESDETNNSSETLFGG